MRAIGLGAVVLIAAHGSTVIASGSTDRALQTAEIRSREDQHPRNAERTLSATCGADKYEMAVAVGRKGVSSSILRAQVNGRSRAAELRSVLTSLPQSAVAIVDIDIDRCEGSRARWQLDILQIGKPPNVHHYYFWLGRSGPIDMIGER